MTLPNSSTAWNSDLDADLDRFLERLDHAQGEAQVQALIEEFSEAYPKRASEFLKLVEGWRQLRSLRDPDRLGPYRIRGVIGIGGMGKVYEAEEDELNRIVAVKTIKPDKATDPLLLARFDRERKAIARLHHTHIVPIFATGKQSDLLYFAMPRIQGATLRTLIKTAAGMNSIIEPRSPITTFDELVMESSRVEESERASEVAHQTETRARDAEKSVPPAPKSIPKIPDYREKAVRIMIEVAEAVHHAHLASVIHRDLKPSNIIIERSAVGGSYHAWVLDFGLALFKVDDDEHPPPDGIGSRPSSVDFLTVGPMGTPFYMAPEQFDPAPERRSDARTDVYALGTILYELLTYRRAVVDPQRTGDHPDWIVRVRDQIRNEPTPPLTKFVREIPRELEAVCLKALNKRPEDRYESAQELASDLRRWLEGKPTKAGKASFLTRLRMLVQRRRAASLAVAAVAVSIVGAAAGSVYLSKVQAAQLNAELDLSNHRVESLRERDLVAFQRLRVPTRKMDWFQQAWELIRARRKASTEADPLLQGHAAATLEGIDARIVKTAQLRADVVAFDPHSKWLLACGWRQSQPGQTSARTVLWDLTADKLVVDRDLGDGMVAVQNDGSPLQLSFAKELPKESGRYQELVLFKVSADKAAQDLNQRFRSPVKEATDLRAIAISREGSRLAAAAWPPLENSDLLAIAGRETTIAVWDVDSRWDGAFKEPIKVLKHSGTQGLVLSPDGRLLAAWDVSAEITVWTLPDARQLTRFRVGRAPVNNAAFGRDPFWHEDSSVPPWVLAVGDSSTLITVWDLRANRPRNLCSGTDFSVGALDFSPDGAMLLSGGHDKVKLWDVATGTCVLNLPFGPFGVAFAADGQTCSLVLDKLYLLKVDQGHGIRTLFGLRGAVEKTAISADGRLIAGASHEYDVGVWETDSGRLIRVFPAPVGRLADSIGLAVDQTGSRLACSVGQEARLWSLVSSSTLRSWSLPEGLCESLAFSDKDHLLLARQENKSRQGGPFNAFPSDKFPRVVRLYDLLGPTPIQPLAEIDAFDRHVYDIKMAPDGSVFAVDGEGTDQGKIRRRFQVHHGATGRLLRALPTSFRGGSAQFQIAADSKTLATILAGKEPPFTLFGLPSLDYRGTSSAFMSCLSTDARWSMNSSSDPQPSITLLDVESGKPLLRVAEDVADRQNGRRFSPDGQHAILGRQNGTVSVLDLPTIKERLAGLNLAW
jgi:serine/threonine protein kinase/WD40 repeat protein